MNISCDWGVGTLKASPWRIQVYWPYVRIRSNQTRNFKEIMLSADTVFRFSCETNYFGIGIQVLGIGIAMDYSKESSTP